MSIVDGRAAPRRTIRLAKTDKIVQRIGTELAKVTNEW